MAFLNKSMLAKMAEEATASKHPMLEKLDVPLNVKEAYLQGCVLAAVLKDEALSESKKISLSQLGTSLLLSDSEISECISIVTGLSSDDAKEQFVGEIIATLSGGVYPKYFLKDFEGLLKENGEIPADMEEYLNYFGSTLCNDKNWRNAIFATSEIGMDPKEATPKNVESNKDQCKPTKGTHTIGRLSSEANRADELLVEGYYIDTDCCVACGCCATTCQAGAISEGSTYEIDSLKCLNCGACASQCPAEAIKYGQHKTKIAANQYSQTESNHSGHFIRPMLCVGCGCCIDSCPADAITEGTPYVIDPDKCVDCGACAAACPNEAIIA